jgi:hypothetical protein
MNLQFSVRENDHSSLRLHHAIQEFKKKQADKSALEHRLGILKQKCEATRRKAKVVQTQVTKITHIKSEYKRHKDTVFRHLFRLKRSWLMKRISKHEKS